MRLALWALAAGAGALAAQDSRPAPVWYGEVQTIVERRCAGCHRKGEIAPFALERHADAAARAGMIAEVVESGRMPPWSADPAFGRFANDRTLPPKEKAALLAWADGGAPAGDPARDVPAPPRVEGWRIGAPDAVFAMAAPFRVPAEGVVDLQYFLVPVPFDEDRWVQAIEIRPGARAAVHHVAVFNVRFDDVESVIAAESMRSGQNGFWALMAPGEEPTVYPAGTAKRLLARSTLVISVHYTAVGRPLEDVTRVGVVFAKSPPAREVKTATATAIETLVLPPESAETVIEAGREVPQAIEILAMVPHMHLRGKAFRFKADYPASVLSPEAPALERIAAPFVRLRTSWDPATRRLGYKGAIGADERRFLEAAFATPAGRAAVAELQSVARSEVLLWVPRFDVRWQHTYRPDPPKPIPAGTLLHCIGIFDNSAANPHLTPEMRRRTVRYGTQIWDEMMMGCFDYVAR